MDKQRPMLTVLFGAAALTPTLSCRAHSRKHALAVSAADRVRSETPPAPRAAGEGANQGFVTPANSIFCVRPLHVDNHAIKFVFERCI
jgi:hypothetical protein